MLFEKDFKELNENPFGYKIYLESNDRLTLEIGPFSFIKHCEESVSYIRSLPLEEMPLHINDTYEINELFAWWRLKIGR